MKTKTLGDTLIDTLADVEAMTLIDTRGEVKAEALVNTLAANQM